jgi:hypothetical protein
MSITNTNNDEIMGKKMKFTEDKLKNIKLPKVREIYDDTTISGLSLFVYPSGVKTFYMIYTPKNNSSTQQIKIGRWPRLTITSAKAKIREYWRPINTEDDPFAVRQKHKSEHTVATLIDEYIKSELSKKSASTQ